MPNITIGTKTFDTDNKVRAVKAIHGYGTVTREYIRERPSKAMCSGCRDDFYNDHNDMGVKECWAFKDAKVVDKVGHTSIHVCGGVNGLMEKTLSCWHAVCN